MQQEIIEGEMHEVFDIPGFGQIALSDGLDWGCSKGVGFSFCLNHVYEGFHGGGGVLDMPEAERLANFILQKIAEKKEQGLTVNL